MEQNAAYILPLDSLFQRLELAGFKLSPADRLRAWRVLSGPGKNCIDKPAALKTLLAPVLSRSATEQEKFHELFDLFYAEISIPLPLPEKAKKTPPVWLIILLLATLTSFLVPNVWDVFRSASDNEMSLAIAGPASGHIGDTVSFLIGLPEELSEETVIGNWQYYNVAEETIEFQDSVLNTFSFVVPPTENHEYKKEIRFQLQFRGTDSLLSASHDFMVLCKELPDIGSISGRTQADALELISFSALGGEKALETFNNNGRDKLVGPASKWLFEWNFGDKQTAKGWTVSHAFQKDGQYNVMLTVTDPSTGGNCSVQINHAIKIGQDAALLPLLSLQKDSFNLIGQWGWGFWLILGIISLALIYYWVHWFSKRKKARQARNAAAPSAAATRFQVSDKAPYFIPLPNKNKLILSSQKIIRFADALRIRQQGLRKEMDVFGTLQSTIDKGGFPNLQYKHASKPSEYLFLIDEQARSSHLGQLFRYLAQSLQEQDLNMEVYYYRRQLNRFWNRREEEGLSLEMLYRQYGTYRLMVCGDLHDLIDPHAKEDPQLRQAYTITLRQWKQAYLFTPTPPVSWTYREKLLAKLFNIYPCDIDGLAAAALDIENDTDPLVEGMVFERWEDLHKKQRNDSDTEYRRWRRLSDINDYFSNYHPDLRKWFLALAVFPKLRWEMTLSIGYALGIQVTYDNLLVLARIPALQKDHLDERLRQKMLEELDSRTERIARNCVKKELEGLKLITAGSHAAHDLETALAVQEFALSPNNQSNRDAIRFLMTKGLLNKASEKELDRITQQATAAPQKISKSNIQSNVPLSKSDKTLRSWLDEDSPTKPNKEKVRLPIFTADFWKAFAATALYMTLLFFASKWAGTAQLHKAFFKERTVNAMDSRLRHSVFVKEEVLLDSALIYNNQGVEEWRTAGDTSAAIWFQKALKSAEPFLPGKNDQFNGQAYSYGLANANLATVYYNEAVRRYNAFLDPTSGSDSTTLTFVQLLLDKAYRSDTLALEVLHAKGLTHFYNRDPEDSVMVYYNKLDELKYFDTISYSPNLASLVGMERSHILNASAQHIGDQVLNVTVDLVATDWPFSNYNLKVFPGEVTGRVPDTVRQNVAIGLASHVIPLEPLSRGGVSMSIIVQLVGASNKIVDQKIIDINHQWFIAKQVTSPPTRPSQPTDDPPKQNPIPATPSDTDTNPNSTPTAPLFIEPQVARISGGDFLMGCQDAKRDGNCADNERPAHEVTVNDFYIGKHEISNREFVHFLNEKDNQQEGGRSWIDLEGNFNGEKCRIQKKGELFIVENGYDSHPVLFVNWYGARAYANWLSQKSRKAYRLPTEVEWEFAARGGNEGVNSTFYRPFSGSSNITDVAWFSLNSTVVQPVGQKASNRLGLYDMSGNAWEWCADTWSNYQIAQEQNTKVPTYQKGGPPPAPTGKVVRGGAWSSTSNECRVASRRQEQPSSRSNNTSFRLARD